MIYALCLDLIFHAFGCHFGYLKRYAVEGALDGNFVNHVAARALDFFCLELPIVFGGVSQMVGGGYTEQVGKYFRMAVVAFELEAHRTALELIERGGGGFLLNPHKKFVWFSRKEGEQSGGGLLLW